MNRKRLILIVLLGALGLCLTYAFYATPRLETAPPRTAGPRPVVKKNLPAKGSLQRVHLDLLQETVEPYPGAKRDIFRFKVKRVAPPVVVPVKRPAPVVVPPPPPVLPVPVAVTQQALARFTFLGFLEKEDIKTVFLSSGNDLYVVRPGDRFGKDKEFVATSLDDKTLNIQRSGDSQIIRIPLVENEKLQPVISSPAARAGSSGYFPVQRSASMPFRRGLRGGGREAGVPPEDVGTFEDTNPEETNPEETNPENVIEEQPQETGAELQGEANGTNQ